MTVTLKNDWLNGENWKFIYINGYNWFIWDTNGVTNVVKPVYVEVKKDKKWKN